MIGEMNLSKHVANNRKYAWREITRVNPAKRAAVERARDFREITQLYDEKTVREQAARCLQCPQPSCVQGCPLQNRIPEWLALAAEGDFLKAAAVSQSTSNMPEICSRICPQERLCEGSCILNARSDPVTIGAVEKFINEYALAHEPPEPVQARNPNGWRVAVVGSGPGGLACADELAKLNCDVTVFEAQPTLGGLLMNGIPSFKLEKWVVQRRVDVLRRRGVVFRCGVKVGQDVPLEQLRKEFHAVFLGTGAPKAKSLDVPGGPLKGIHPAIPFLVQKNVEGSDVGETIDVTNKKVAVLGGGDTAMDCLRTALRCGAAQSICIYRRDLANMPGSRKEYYNAVEEGAQFQFLTNPVALESNGGSEITGVRCVRMELGEPDAEGRRKPRPVPGSEFVVPADILLVAYGFDPEPFPKTDQLADIPTNDWGAVIVDRNQMTKIPGIFAGGDLSRGASLAVHAVRDGRKAAMAILRYLQQ